MHLLSDGFFEINMGFLVYGKPDYYQKTYWASLHSLLIITEEHRILCDSGLGELPEHRDIDYIIQTHLHFDHFTQDILAFKNATIIAQAEEIRYAFLPDRFQANGYSPIRALLGKIHFDPVTGYKEVANGIGTIPTAGHTPGHQSVAIQTGEELIVYTGDAAPLQENFDRRNIPGVLWSSWQALESIDILRELKADRYIFSHSNDEEEVI
ncbi:MAG: MBL fold metallo-hydrolase [Candidatus Hodarchaeales archaeon]